MTLSKQFMAWAIGLSNSVKLRQPTGALPERSQRVNVEGKRHPQTSRRRTNTPISLRALSVRLLLSYLGAMVAVLGVSGIAVYQYFAHNLLQEVDQQMTMLAAAAKHNFASIRTIVVQLSNAYPNRLMRMAI